MAFTRNPHNQGYTPRGSATWGGIYAPYLVQPYSNPTDYVANTSFPIQQELYYLISTWNPYVVDMMKSTVRNNDADDDSVPTYASDGTTPVDNCPLAYNPDQANCNLEAEEAWNLNHPQAVVPILGDACEPVPCPRANADRATARSSVCQQPDRYVTTICRGREVHDEFSQVSVRAACTNDLSLVTGPNKRVRV